MWEAIQYVTSGLSLAAFLAAIGAWVYKARLESHEKLIASAKEDQRADLVARTLEYFDVDTPGLTKEQRYDLAIVQIHARSKRFQQTAVVICFIAIISGLLAGYAISRGDPVPGPTTPGGTEADKAAREATALAACVSTKTVDYEAEMTGNIEGGASASAPGAKGGKNTDERPICYSVGPDQQIVTASTTTLSCHGGRCSVTAPAYDDDRRKVCVTASAWSESKSFGGGGSGKYRLNVTFKKVATSEVVSRFEVTCRAAR